MPLDPGLEPKAIPFPLAAPVNPFLTGFPAPGVEFDGKDLVDGAGLGVGIGTAGFRFVAAGVAGVEEAAFAFAIVVLRSPGISCYVQYVNVVQIQEIVQLHTLLLIEENAHPARDPAAPVAEERIVDCPPVDAKVTPMPLGPPESEVSAVSGYEVSRIWIISHLELVCVVWTEILGGAEEGRLRSRVGDVPEKLRILRSFFCKDQDI